MNTGLLSKVYIVSTCSFHVSQLIMWPGTVMWKEVRFLFLKIFNDCCLWSQNLCGCWYKAAISKILSISTTYIPWLDFLFSWIKLFFKDYPANTARGRVCLGLRLNWDQDTTKETSDIYIKPRKFSQ